MAEQEKQSAISKTSRATSVEAPAKVEEQAATTAHVVAVDVAASDQDATMKTQPTMLEQLRTLKQDLLELSQFMKSEMNIMMSELTKLGNELKEDVSEISNKHKEHLTETLKRSKESGREAWNKVRH